MRYNSVTGIFYIIVTVLWPETDHWFKARAMWSCKEGIVISVELNEGREKHICLNIFYLEALMRPGLRVRQLYSGCPKMWLGKERPVQHKEVKDTCLHSNTLGRLFVLAFFSLLSFLSLSQSSPGKTKGRGWVEKEANKKQNRRKKAEK